MLLNEELLRALVTLTTQALAQITSHIPKLLKWICGSAYSTFGVTGIAQGQASLLWIMAEIVSIISVC